MGEKESLAVPASCYEKVGIAHVTPQLKGLGGFCRKKVGATTRLAPAPTCVNHIATFASVTLTSARLTRASTACAT